MKLLLVGLLLWSYAIFVVARLIRVGAPSWLPSARSTVLACLAMAGAVLLLFRPHQDFFGGQDQGAYANAAVTYARRGALTYTDPLLSQVPEETRPAFFYGDELFPDTKDMCFWVEDIASAKIGTWFQPAFPILMSVAAAVGPDTWVLYVTPIFTLFTAIALWALARLLLNRPGAGIAAFVFYVVNPITLWHGRGVRAEAAASFFLFAGCFFIARAWRDRDRPARTDIITGALCFTLAPFFHVSSWLVVIPTAAALGLALLGGYAAFLPYAVIAFAGATAFLVQTRVVTDSYALTGLLDFIFRNPTAWMVAGICLILALAFWSLHTKKRWTGEPSFDTAPKNHRLAAGTTVLAAVTVFVFLLAYRGILPGPDKKHAIWVLRLVGVTEFRAFVEAVTRPLALAGLAGWVCLIVQGGERRLSRVVLALSFFPAMILVGDMPILMYFLRRAFPVIVPVFALSLAALVCLLPAGRSVRKRLAVVVAIVGLSLLGIGPRSRLLTMTDYKGFPAFLRSFAEIIERSNGILLCEYSRIAAPFEHLFGIPTLGLDNERRFEYGPALRAWEDIVTRHPDQPAFFITPFGPPISDRFTFTPVLASEHRMRFLRSAPKRLPVTIRDPLLSLSLYRMHSAVRPERPPQVYDSPYVREFDESNMGLKGFHSGRRRNWELTGFKLKTGTTYRLGPAEAATADTPSAPQGRAELLLICRCPSREPPMPVVKIGGAVPDTHLWQHLSDEWWVYRANSPATDDGVSVEIVPPVDMLLAAGMMVGDKKTRRLAVNKLRPSGEEKEIFSRWARAEAQVAVPVPPGGKGLVLMLVNPSHPDEHKNLRLRVSTEGTSSPAYSMPMAVQGWQWLACPFPWSDTDSPVRWISLTTSPPWNPGRYGYPRDLGVHIKYLAVLPEMKDEHAR